jgi:hypothetical protein
MQTIDNITSTVYIYIYIYCWTGRGIGCGEQISAEFTEHISKVAAGRRYAGGRPQGKHI